MYEIIDPSTKEGYVMLVPFEWMARAITRAMIILHLPWWDYGRTGVDW